jgi:hypothetical protein
MGCSVEVDILRVSIESRSIFWRGSKPIETLNIDRHKEMTVVTLLISITKTEIESFV